MRDVPASSEAPTLSEQVQRLVSDFRSMSPAKLREGIGLDCRTVLVPDPDSPGGVVRIDPDGTRTPGQLKGRAFVPRTN